jgi:hypothetical protein
MLTEFEVRRYVASIHASNATPERKARMLLRLGRSLRIQAQSLVHAQAAASRASNRNAEAHMERMARSARMLHEEVRALAHSALSTQSSLRFSAN